MTTHELKLSHVFFADVLNNLKRAELRKADRPFQVGDHLLLNEMRGEVGTGKSLRRVITHIYSTPAHGLLLGYVMLSIRPLTREEKAEL